MSFSPDGEILAVALRCGDSGIYADPETMQLVHTGKTSPAILFYDTSTYKRKEGNPSYTGPVNDLRFSPTGRFLAWTGSLGWAYVYDLEVQDYHLALGFPEIVNKRSFAGSGDVLAFSPDGKYLACGGDAERIEIWEVKSGKAVR